jgi:DNA mismatch repair protein MutS2
VIENAKQNVDRSSLDASEYLTNLRREVAEAEDLRRAVEEERRATAEKYAQLERDFQKREQERSREFERELAKTLEEFDRQSRALLEGIEDKTIRAKIEKDAQARKAELKRAAAATINDQSAFAGDSKAKEQAPKSDLPIAVGAKVRLKNFGSIGTVEKLSDNEAEVLVGVMRLREKVENLERVADVQPQAQGKLERLQEKAKRAESNLRFEEENRNAELNLVGKRTDEAEDLLDKFLDNAYLSGFPRVRVIHGIGTGALRAAVHSFLKNHPHVQRYAIAAQDEGGNGATVVELKK